MVVSWCQYTQTVITVTTWRSQPTMTDSNVHLAHSSGLCVTNGNTRTTECQVKMAGHINPFQSWHLKSCSNVTQAIVTTNSNYIWVSQGHVIQTACLKANKMSHKTLLALQTQLHTAYTSCMNRHLRSHNECHAPMHISHRWRTLTHRLSLSHQHTYAVRHDDGQR